MAVQVEQAICFTNSILGTTGNTPCIGATTLPSKPKCMITTTETSPQTDDLHTLSVQCQGIYKISLGTNSTPLEGQRVIATLTDQLGRTLPFRSSPPLEGQGEVSNQQSTNTFEIDPSEYSQGIYFLNINGYKSVKLVR